MKSYIAQRQISHDNRLCQEGELLDLDDATAKPLLDIGAVIEAPATKAETPKKTASKAE